MQEMVLVLVLLLLALIFAAGWAVSYVGMKAILFYMKEKNYRPPDKVELKKWCKYAARRILGLLEDDAD